MMMCSLLYLKIVKIYFKDFYYVYNYPGYITFIVNNHYQNIIIYNYINRDKLYHVL